MRGASLGNGRSCVPCREGQSFRAVEQERSRNTVAVHVQVWKGISMKKSPGRASEPVQLSIPMGGGGGP